MLAATLQLGQIVGLDNLRQQPSARVRAAIEVLVAAIWAALAAITPLMHKATSPIAAPGGQSNGAGAFRQLASSAAASPKGQRSGEPL